MGEKQKSDVILSGRASAGSRKRLFKTGRMGYGSWVLRMTTVVGYHQ